MRLIDFYQENKKLYDDILNTIEHYNNYCSCGKHTIYEEQSYILTVDTLSVILSNPVDMFWVIFTVKCFDEIVYESSGYLPIDQIDRECFFLSLLCKYDKLSMIKEINKDIFRKVKLCV